jgi:type VI secretion system VasI/ImpG family protein
MNNDLLNAYRHELRFLREVGDEFAAAYPEYARALASDALGASDPAVERLLEGVAFLTAKTACRLDAEGERLAQDVLRATMPDLLYPLPPVAMVELQPLNNPSAQSTSKVPRGTAVRYQSGDGDAIQFLTVADVDLLPLRLRVLQAPAHQAILSAIESPAVGAAGRQLAGCDVLRVELSTLGGQSLSSVLKGRLRIHCAGDDGLRLWAALTQKAQALLMLNPDDEGTALKAHKSPRLLPCGWHDDEALLPDSCALAGPYRLLREWVHCRQRFAFGELLDLPTSLADFRGSKLELWWFLPQGTLLGTIAKDSLRLFCTPVVNVEHLRCDPMAMQAHASEYSVCLPSHKAGRYRIAGIDRVEYRSGDGRWQQLLPLHQLYRQGESAHYAVRLQPRWSATPGRNTALAQWEWRIAPSLQAPDQREAVAFTAASVWASRLDVSKVLADDGQHWRLDFAAPVTGVRGVGFVVAGQTVPLATQALLRAAMTRFEHIAHLAPEEAARSLQRWLRGIDPEFVLPGVRSLQVELSARGVPFAATPVVAQGYSLRFEMDSVRPHDSELVGLLQIVAAMLARQLGVHAFVTASAVAEGQPIAENVVWR